MLIDSTKSAHENVVALINATNGTSISPLLVTTEVTGEAAGTGNRNTQITVSAVVPAAPFRGDVVVNLHRIDFAANETAPVPMDLDFAPGTTGEAILAEIADRMDLVASDVEFVTGHEPVDMTDMMVRICGKLNSRLYLRNYVEVPVSWIRPPLSDFVSNLQLNGYGDLTDQFDAALTHWAGLISDYATVVYVDAATGNDTAPTTGERTAPFASIKYAETRAAANTAIIVANGTYTQDVQDSIDAVSGGGLRPGSKKLGYFAQPLGVLVNCVGGARRDVHALVSFDAGTKVGGLVLKLITAGRTESYTVAFAAGNQGGIVAGQLYNCVLTSDGPASLVYSNTGASDFQLNNCALHATGNALANYAGTPGKIAGTAAKTGFSLTATVTTPANLSGQQFDAEWHASNVSDSVNNDATVGVYSGTYAW